MSSPDPAGDQQATEPSKKPRLSREIANLNVRSWRGGQREKVAADQAWRLPGHGAVNGRRVDPLLLESLTEQEKQNAIAKFVRFLQFETVSATAPASGAYQACADWLVSELRDLGFMNEVFLLPEAPLHSPVVVARWAGKHAEWPVLLLNSHYDVVPVDDTAWTVPAFDGLRRNGKIYGRGSQDMKLVCIQYIEALRKIRQQQGAVWLPERDIYLTFVPDEEIGGGGMAAFLESSTYKKLPGIALALDEGLASTTDAYSVFYGERLPWWVEINCTGPTGHGSRFIDNTAVEQLVELAKKALKFRKGQRAQLGLDDHSNCAHAVAKKTLGDVTSLNITTLQAGVKSGDTFAYNCVPPKASCTLDIRISPHMEPSEMEGLLNQWCQECSKTDTHRVSWSHLFGQTSIQTEHALTSTEPSENAWYSIFERSLKSMGISMEPQVFPAATDSRFLRALGIRALGFSPMRNTEILLHENDEYVPEDVFLEGIAVYVRLLETLASHEDE